ncbi:MAG: 4-(cytidine 5'-diphospho)-2-C-methyl-D-erythritol kinase [Opitutaceae bacterium]|jgi:4-diphosphocytidyl-2-C-methyl-D-erythritol kinase
MERCFNRPVHLIVSSPAKLNLFLAITGRRADGFHDLVSVVAPVEFGDTLSVDLRESGFSMECDDPALEIDERNLVLRAARAFAAETGWPGGAHFSLTKRIPMGAGLGGGSSNAASVLVVLNQLSGKALPVEDLARIAAGLGSDCPLFLHSGPVVIRGRGEHVKTLPPQAADRLRGRRVLIFKPMFGISTAWAYRRMAEGGPVSYLPAIEAETKLDAWIDHATSPGESLLLNNMESPAFDKFIALPTALECLRTEFDLSPRMSGSGSACFAFLPENAPVDVIRDRIHGLWGPQSFVAETRLS